MTGRLERFGLERNVGGRDRQLRAVLALVFLAVAGVALGAGALSLSLASLLVAAGLGFNVVTGFCGLNAVLGVDTCEFEGGTEHTAESE